MCYIVIFINDCPFSEFSCNNSTPSANALHYLQVTGDSLSSPLVDARNVILDTSTSFRPCIKSTSP